MHVVHGWSSGLARPAEPTIFVNEVQYTVRCVFATVVGPDQVDLSGDGVANQKGVAMDTTGDGQADAVGIDTTGDGLVDSLVDLTTGEAGGAEFKARVRLVVPSGELQVSLPSDHRDALSLDVLMEALEAWGEASAAAQAAQVAWSTEHDFEITHATVGAHALTPAPLMIDTTGDGVAETEQKLWLMPDGVALGAALLAAGDTLSFKAKVSLTQAAPLLDPCAACCAVM